MPKLYGTALYGKGNYSALTASNVASAQGAYTETGEAALFPLAAKLPAAQGAFALTGFAAGIGKIAWTVSTGLFALAGQAANVISANLWAPTTVGAPAWTPTTPASDPWSPVLPGSTTWTPTV